MPTLATLSRLFKIPEMQLKSSMDQYFASMILGLEFFFPILSNNCFVKVFSVSWYTLNFNAVHSDVWLKIYQTPDATGASDFVLQALYFSYKLNKYIFYVGV